MPVRKANPASASAPVTTTPAANRAETAKADLLRALAAKGVDTSKLDLFARNEDNLVMIFVAPDQWDAMQIKLKAAYATLGATSRSHFDQYTGYDMWLPTHKNGVMYRPLKNGRIGRAR